MQAIMKPEFRLNAWHGWKVGRLENRAGRLDVWTFGKGRPRNYHLRENREKPGFLSVFSPLIFRQTERQ